MPHRDAPPIDSRYINIISMDWIYVFHYSKAIHQKTLLGAMEAVSFVKWKPTDLNISHFIAEA
jgi:hypothetical protein